MRFFLPFAKHQLEAEEVYEGTREFVSESIGPLDARRFYSLSYEHKGETVIATVGEPDPVEGNLVIAIFRSALQDGPYFICTPSRGVLGGNPIRADAGTAARVVEFDAPPR